MWPLYSIFTKNHKAEDGKQLKGDMSGAIDPYHFQHPPIHTALPRSRFVEVSLCDVSMLAFCLV